LTDALRTHGGRPPTNTTSATPYAPIAAVSMPPGAPVAPSTEADHTIVLAQAFTQVAPHAIGLTAAACAAGERVVVQSAGVLTLDEEQWNMITQESGGLQRGKPYFVDLSTPGKLRSTMPVGIFPQRRVVAVGIALSRRDMMIQVSFPRLVRP